MEALLSQLMSALAPIGAVQVAWLFGSRATGRARPDSDLDVAVAFPRTLGSRGRFRARLEVVAALTDALGALGERADVVDIDDSDAAVAFATLSEGRLAFARSEQERIEASVRIMRRNADDLPRRQLFQEAAVRVAREMGKPR
jgi:predicted nucleotidyltransferase